VNEAVDRLIMEREHLDDGLSSSVAVSVTAHVFLIAGALLAPLLMPKPPALLVADGFTVALPRGGGGVPAPPQPKPVEPPPPEPAKVEEPAPAPPPTKVLKPPTEAPRPNALPEPDSRRRAAPRRETAAPAATPAPKATPGASAATPGLEFAPAGPGVPGGTETGGDWYLATVQQKIWLLWNQQIRAGFDHPVGVTFTIQADGQVTDVRVTQPSGAALLDMAAQRAVLNAAPFGPLPREYGTNEKTIQAIFRPAE